MGMGKTGWGGGRNLVWLLIYGQSSKDLKLLIQKWGLRVFHLSIVLLASLFILPMSMLKYSFVQKGHKENPDQVKGDYFLIEWKLMFIKRKASTVPILNAVQSF